MEMQTDIQYICLPTNILCPRISSLLQCKIVIIIITLMLVCMGGESFWQNIHIINILILTKINVLIVFTKKWEEKISPNNFVRKLVLNKNNLNKS